jgi:hypothetical protein
MKKLIDFRKTQRATEHLDPLQWIQFWNMLLSSCVVREEVALKELLVMFFTLVKSA